MLNYGILAPLCDPILDRVPSYRATHQVAALHKAIEGDADVQFANIAPAPTGSSWLLQKPQVAQGQNHQLPEASGGRPTGKKRRAKK